MTHELFEDKEAPGNWRVESRPDSEGIIDVAIFSGPNAKQRAHEYCMWRATIVANHKKRPVRT